MIQDSHVGDRKEQLPGVVRFYTNPARTFNDGDAGSLAA